jgi:hypothetical protein
MTKICHFCSAEVFGSRHLSSCLRRVCLGRGGETGGGASRQLSCRLGRGGGTGAGVGDGGVPQLISVLGWRGGSEDDPEFPRRIDEVELLALAGTTLVLPQRHLLFSSQAEVVITCLQVRHFMPCSPATNL